MKRRTSMNVMLLFFAFFAFLLITGGHRLIASTNADSQAVSIRIVSAYLCSDSCIAQVEPVHTQGYFDPESRLACKSISLNVSSAPERPVFTDANGNILFGKSYMRAVYQSFALGDGFA